MPHRKWEPKIVAFVCNWCTYAGADAAGTRRMHYASNVRMIKLPCTGRIDPHFIVKAFEQGADGVLVSGCHPGDCHYVSGNLVARRRYTVFRELLEFLGVDPRRLQFSWVSAAEGVKWVEVVNAVTQEIRALGPRPVEWAESNGHRPPIVASPEPLAGTAVELPSPQAGAGTTTDSLRAIARELLEKKEVAVVVGYEAGSLPGLTTPAFITRPEDVDRLVWNEHCVNNLSVYLTKKLVTRLGRVGVVVKGCDAKSIVGLIQENQLKRENVTIIGVQCDGVQVDGELAAKCYACDVHTPKLYDHLAKGDTSGGSSTATGTLAVATGTLAAPDPRLAEIAALERMSPNERWAYWQAQFDRCIRCYACRAVCPLCYCETCITDKTRPQWIPTSATSQGNLSWNIFRAYHLAGRCIGCDECTRACPADIRLDLINRKLAQSVQEAFDYTAGFDLEGAPPLTTFRMEDEGEFIR